MDKEGQQCQEVREAGHRHWRRQCTGYTGNSTRGNTTGIGTSNQNNLSAAAFTGLVMSLTAPMNSLLKLLNKASGCNSTQKAFLVSTSRVIKVKRLSSFLESIVVYFEKIINKAIIKSKLNSVIYGS